jgi:hypothetical protein
MIGTKKLGQAACRARRGRFFTAADLISQLEKAHKQYPGRRRGSHRGQYSMACVIGEGFQTPTIWSIGTSDQRIRSRAREAA